MQNRVRKIVLSAMIAGISATVMTPLIAYAGTKHPTREQHRREDAIQIKEDQMADLYQKFGEPAFDAMQKVHAARIAIQAEDFKQAATLVNDANQALDKIIKDGGTGIIPISERQIVDENIYKVDASADQAKADSNSNKGNEVIQADYGSVRLLMPIQQTQKQLKIATDFLTNTKPYDAAKALATAEAGISVQSVFMVTQPEQIQASDTGAS